MMKDWLDEIKWDKDGLVPAIAQDHKTGRVLMMAWMNREALSRYLFVTIAWQVAAKGRRIGPRAEAS
jgi:phosphoribosyl-AMP cyclohydrolase